LTYSVYVNQLSKDKMNIQKNFSVQGKRVLVTGAGTGIGRGIALAFAEAGAHVVFHYSHSAKGAVEAEAKAKEMGIRTKIMQADFTDIESVRSLGRQAIDFLGGIDVLVNNSGITLNMPFLDVTSEQYETLFAVNIRALFFLTQTVVPTMIKQGNGCIINISSVHAFAGMREHSVYAATKGAISSFTRQLSIELAPRGIQVNAIAAGSIEVENHPKVIPEYIPGARSKRIPIGFKGEPCDIASLAIFLASESSRYIIGQTIVVDGGLIGYLPMTDDFTTPLSSTFGKGYVNR